MQVRLCVNSLVLLAAAVTLDPVRASASCAWQLFKPANPSASFDTLVGVAVVAANDVWTFGNSNAAPGLQLQRFNGTTWYVVPAPALPASAAINSMRAVSSNNIWAVGYQQSSQGSLPLIVHWNGLSWAVVHNPAESENGSLLSVVAIGGTYVWAVGQIYGGSHTGPRPLIEHFNGRQWVIDKFYVPPNWSLLQAVTGTSLNNIWAGGYGGGGGGALIERWDRATWSWGQSPTNVGNYIDSMSARSSSDVWAVGPPNESGLFVERWNGAAWNPVPYPRGGTAVLQQVDATASTGYTWFVGIQGSGSNTSAFVDRFRGQWRDMKVLQASNYTVLYSIAPIPGNAGGVWAVGNYQDPKTGTFRNLAERYMCTTRATRG
jgi:hypothetical protein